MRKTSAFIMSRKRRTWHTGIIRLSAVSSKVYTGVTLSPSVSSIAVKCEPILSALNYYWQTFTVVLVQ